MKKTWKKVVSLLMSVMVVFSMMGVPVMAEEAKAAREGPCRAARLEVHRKKAEALMDCVWV